MAEVPEAKLATLSRQSINEEADEKTSPDSLSPEYKSSWNDVNVQGDYDQYARSVTSSRLTNNDAVPPKLMNSLSPRLQDAHEPFDRSSSKKGRVKLNKMNGHVIRPMPGFTSGKAVIKPEVDESVDLKSHAKAESEQEKPKSVPQLENKSEAKRSPTTKEPDKNVQEIITTAAEMETKDKISKDRKTFLSKQLAAEEKAIENKEHTNPHGSRNSVKSNSEFTPPIVTAVDFREPGLTPAVKFATKNGLVVESPDFYAKRTQDGNISRMSTILMASYLGMGYTPNPNLITSFNVKQILPPLHPKNKPIIRRNRVLKRKRHEASETSKPDHKTDVIVSKSNDAKELAPLRDSHLYKWKHDPVSKERHTVKETPYRLPPRNGEIETIFDQIVRWRSKVRHCGKPAMYRRITSPTLGEVALRRKLTDRLPTRQVRKIHLEPKEMQAKEEAEESRGPRSKVSPNTSVKQFIKERLHDAQKDGSMTSPTVIEGFYDVTMKMKQTSLRRRLELNNEILKLPLPDLSLRKRQPVWQRMK